MGSLVKIGSHFYAMWRYEGKQFKQVLRDENGAACTTEREAEAAKQKLMRLFVKKDKVETLQNIQNRIASTQGEVDSLTPALSLVAAWTAFASPTSGRKPCEKSTLGSYEYTWTQFQDWLETEHPDVKTLRGVTVEIAKGYLDSQLARGVSPTTYNNHLALLRYIFKTLRKPARLTENVWMEFPRMETNKESRRELTIDELKLVCSKAKGEMKTLFAIGLYTGLRLGDACTLRWGEVDLNRNLIRRIPNKIRRKKGARGLLQIPIHPVLHDLLQRLPGDKISGFVLPETANRYLGKCRSRVTDLIQAHFEDCGIETLRERENGIRSIVNVGYHSLRHSFITLCALSGTPLAVLQSLVGHSSPKMTEIYSHSNRLAEQNAVAALPAIEI